MDALVLDFSSPWWLVPVIALGACVGSFLNVVIYRLPLGLSVRCVARTSRGGITFLCYHGCCCAVAVPLVTHRSRFAIG
jgi:prepilin signal peptidase PulO-like enzyme (type II secretory pathway)